MIRVSSRTHGIMDLFYSAAFMAAPFLLKSLSAKSGGRTGGYGSSYDGQSGIDVEDVVLPAIGAAILTQALTTDFELGAVKAVPMHTHLLMDLGVGALVAASPWLLNMDKKLRVPMVALGAAQIGLALVTETEPRYDTGIEDEMEKLVEELVD